MKETRHIPLSSMTGYAVETFDLDAGQISLELRAVNSRYLDLSFRMAEEFRALDLPLRERISASIKRGKLECRIHFTPRQDSVLPASVNAVLLAQLGKLADQTRNSHLDAAPMTVTEILRWPGMLGDNHLDIEVLHAAALSLIDKVIVQFNASRAREGEKLAAFIQERVMSMREHVTRIRPRTPEIIAAYRDKLNKRLQELLTMPDADRLHQEVALFAQKIDIDEELDRLLAHLGEIERVLKAGGSAGKRLDFIMQELNRESNTLGSKSVSLELTQTSVELKVLIEQMREQVQNIE